jgi:hypothetical protein
MDLEQANSSDANSWHWSRIGTWVCFAVAAGILIVSLFLPGSARATHPGTGLTVSRTL